MLYEDSQRAGRFGGGLHGHPQPVEEASRGSGPGAAGRGTDTQLHGLESWAVRTPGAAQGRGEPAQVGGLSPRAVLSVNLGGPPQL